MYLPYPPNVGGYGKLMKKTDEQNTIIGFVLIGVILSDLHGISQRSMKSRPSIRLRLIQLQGRSVWPSTGRTASPEDCR